MFVIKNIFPTFVEMATERFILQIPIKPALRKKLLKASSQRGYETVATYCRVILTELEAKGYFDNAINEIPVYKLTDKK